MSIKEVLVCDGCGAQDEVEVIGGFDVNLKWVQNYAQIHTVKKVGGGIDLCASCRRIVDNISAHLGETDTAT